MRVFVLFLGLNILRVMKGTEKVAQDLESYVGDDSTLLFNDILATKTCNCRTLYDITQEEEYTPAE